MSELFDTKEKQLDAIAQFKLLQMHPGWMLVVDIVKENLAVLEQQLRDGAPEQTIADVNRLRDKIKDHENFINTPETMIERFNMPESQVENDDPYPEQ